MIIEWGARLVREGCCNTPNKFVTSLRNKHNVKYFPLRKIRKLKSSPKKYNPGTKRTVVYVCDPQRT